MLAGSLWRVQLVAAAGKGSRQSAVTLVARWPGVACPAGRQGTACGGMSAEAAMLYSWHAGGVVQQTILPGAAHAATPAGCPLHRVPPQGRAATAAAGHAHLPRSPVGLEVVSQQVGGINYDHREAPFLHRAPKSLHQTGHVRLCISHTHAVRQPHTQTQVPLLSIPAEASSAPESGCVSC